MKITTDRKRANFLFRALFFLLALCAVCASPWLVQGLVAEEGLSGQILLREDFNSLARWKPLLFSKVEHSSAYTLDPQPDKECYVKATSDNSASGMVLDGEFNVYDYPMIRWRWKVSNVYESGNALEKEGDDYPMRVYVMFKYDTTDPNVKKKFKYSLGKLFYGKYPPYSSLTYIWANREHHLPFIPNAYAKEAVMIPVQSGASLANTWLVQERNILDDYRRAFGTDPPAVASLAFMNDSDNTGESSVSWIDWIEIFRNAKNFEKKGEGLKVKGQ